MRRVILVLVLAAALALATASVAWARTPITVSQHLHQETDSFTGYVNCQGEKLYDITFTINELVRITAAGEAKGDEGVYFDLIGKSYLAPLHFHHTFVGRFVAVPVNGRGPTYAGHARDTEQLNARSFEEFVGTYTDDHKVTARGTDGSKINYHLHVHTTVNAKGKPTFVSFRVRPDESCITPGE